MAMLDRNPRMFMDYEDNGAFGDDLFGSYPITPVAPLSQVAPVASVAPTPVVQSPLSTPVTPPPSRYNISSPEVQAQVYAAQESARQAEATRQAELAQQAEAKRLADIESAYFEQQARVQAEQQAEAARQAEIARQTQLAQQQEAERLAEVERQGALQRAEAARQAEAAQRAEQERLAAEQAENERQGALQRAEAERQAEAAKQAEQARLASTNAPVQDALTYLNSNPTGTPSLEQQKVIDDYFAANPINIDENTFKNTFGGFDLNGGLKLNPPEEQKKLNELDKIVDPLTQQILGQGLTDKWSGQGFGSAEANARDMAKIMAGIGITDIKQFGKVPQYEQAEVQYGVNGRAAQQDSEGNYYIMVPGGIDSEGNQMMSAQYIDQSQLNPIYGVRKQIDSEGNTAFEAVDPSKVVTKNGVPMVQTGETFGNKVTGQAVPNTYSERQTGNFFGGTFEGKGNTGYGVQFDAQGNPYFYTQGASSNDLANIMKDLGPIGQIGLAIATGGLSIPQQIAANMAIQVLSGKDIGDAIKGAALSYAGAQIPGLDAIKEGTSFIQDLGLSADLTNTLTRSFQNAAVSGGTALLSGKNVGEAMIQGAVTGGTSGAVNALLGNIDGFADLTPAQKNMAINAVTGVVSGKPLDQIVIDSAIAAANAEVAKARGVNQVTTTQGSTTKGTADDAISKELDKQLTFDATGASDINTAATNAEAQGYNKFTFDGKTYTLDSNEDAKIANLESAVKTETTAKNLAGGEFEGVDAAVAANAASNNTVIGNAEADNPEEAAYLAKQRNPTGTTFTYGGQTYTMGVSDAAVNQALNETQKTAVLDDIKNAKTFNEAFATARSSLGPGQTFTWQGKEYSTATAAERPDLSTPSIDEINARNLATSTDASKTVAAQSDTAARETASQELAKQQANATKATESSGFFSNLAKSIQDQMKLSSEAANDYLKNNPNSPITNSVSTAYEAAGNLQKNAAGGVALLLDNKPLADAFVKSGDDLTKFGQSIGNGVVDSKNWNDTMSLLENAKGFDKIGILAGRIMDGNSGLGRQVEVELRQELPGLFLGGGSVKGILLATGAMDVAETTGNAALEAYDAAAKRGLTHADALTEARKAGAAAGVAEAAIQLTLGKVADVVIGKVGSVAGKAGTKILGEGFVEAGQEGTSFLAVNAALGQDLDVNKALTQSIVGGAVGKGTSATTSPVDIATSQTINNNITTAATTGDASAVNTAITNSVQQSLTSGASVDTAVGTTVSSAITNGADASSSITNAVTTAVQSGADSTQVVGSAVTSAIDAGADVSTSVSTAVQAAVTSGADTTTVINSSVTAAVSSGADATTAVTTAVTAAVNASVTQAVTNGTDVSTAITNSVSSSVSSAVTNNTSVTTAVDTAVSTAISSAVTNNTDVTAAVNSSVSSAITSAIDGNVDSSTAVSTAVDSAVTTAIENNVDSSTAITTAVDTAITTAINANTDANVNTVVNDAVMSAVDAAVNSGVDVTTAVNAAVDAAVNANVNTKANIDIPALVKAAVEKAKTSAELVDLRASVNDLIAKASAPTATPEPAKTTKPTTTAQSSGLNAGLLAGVMSSGELSRLPPQMLKAYMTQDKFVDPLAKLQSLQEDMNTEKMQPQVNTQDTEMPDQGTWKYGNAPDDIESLFGEEEEEAAFKEGGYVAPLQMASGGAMPLPLLVKSGGALGALPRPDGRMDFRHGAHVAGEGDGQSDDIKAMLADGEFVFPADVVSALGNGSTKAGSDKLYEMMHSIRARARSKKPKDLPPPALKSPLDYLKKKR